MNFSLILKAPWRSARAPVRWVMCSFFVLLLIAAACILIFNKNKEGAITDAIGAIGFGMVYVWAFFVSHMLLMAMDARDLRIPQLPTNIVASLVLYAALCIALPAIALSLLGGHALAIAVVMALCVLGGLLFAWLPRYFASPMGLLPALMIGARRVVDIPGPSQPEFLSWALPLTLVLALLIAYRWRQLMRTHGMLQQSMRSPMVMQFRRIGENSWGTFGTAFSKETLSQQPAWMLAKADLRKVGPNAPLQTIRVALGGFYMPKTWRGLLLTAAQFSFLLIILAAVVLMIGLDSKVSLSGALTHIALPLGASLAIYGTALISIVTIARFSQRWRKTNTELPLLALMPGLGDAAKVKREFLRASLSLPMRWQIGLAVAMIAGALYLHVDAAIIVSIAAAQLCSVALLPAVLLRVIGGRPPQAWMFVVGTLMMIVLLNAGCVLPVLAKDDSLHPNIDYVALAVTAVWAVMGLVMVYLGRTGWRSLQHRPHAFLANQN
ncbi:hypothetical protein [Dyella sp. GSA-30]|uniref:hypothetical protein n=1 Tax=Dyella sp. GSA-30 TaxID=2994496 RepID=UPI002491D5AD|nr:hypothetical protein [Dyella sp. GSA-30]BDU19439.1 hypothetical protein DYGSA30_08960 [Dyella sp. GSA-30]